MPETECNLEPDALPPPPKGGGPRAVISWHREWDSARLRLGFAIPRALGGQLWAALPANSLPALF